MKKGSDLPLYSCYYKFAERLKTLRGANNTGKRDPKSSIPYKTRMSAAESIGVSYREYRAWENGQRVPSIDSVITVAKYYSVSVDYMLGLSDFTTPENEYIGQETGLTENAIKRIARIRGKKKGGAERFATLNALLVAPQFEYLLEILRIYPPVNRNFSTLYHKNGTPIPQYMERATFEVMLRDAMNDIIKSIHSTLSM